MTLLTLAQALLRKTEACPPLLTLIIIGKAAPHQAGIDSTLAEWAQIWTYV